MKEQKKVNPYAKKANRKKIRITRAQWIAGVCVLAIVATLVCFKLFYDPHAGHDHSNTSTGEHFEGDGHDHGHGNTTPSNTTDKVKYQIYTNADQTYRLVIRDQKNAIVFEKDKMERQPLRDTINESEGIYELSWALYKEHADNGPNDFECIYYNVKTGQVSDLFVAPRGCNGVRIAYGSEDQTKIIVQDLFDKNAYYKEHELANATEKNGDIIISGSLKPDKKTVVIAYHSSETENDAHTTINLYE